MTTPPQEPGQLTPEDFPWPGDALDVDGIVTPVFSVTVTVDDRTSASKTADARDEFWESYFPAGYKWGAADAEKLLLLDFDEALVREARIFRQRRASKTPTDPGPEPARFAFQIKPPFKYGSLTFVVAVSGATQLAKYLFNEPDLVLAFLDICVPKAFSSAERTGSGGRPNFAITPNEALKNELYAPEKAASAAQAASASKSKWDEIVQRISQIALLLPTVLALAVLFVAASMINSERDRLKDREKGLDGREITLDAREEKMRASSDAQNARLEATTVELVRQLRSAASEAKAASTPTTNP